MHVIHWGTVLRLHNETFHTTPPQEKSVEQCEELNKTRSVFESKSRNLEFLLIFIHSV